MEMMAEPDFRGLPVLGLAGRLEGEAACGRVQATLRKQSGDYPVGMQVALKSFKSLEASFLAGRIVGAEALAIRCYAVPPSSRSA
jgi:hypothetical protein